MATKTKKRPSSISKRKQSLKARGKSHGVVKSPKGCKHKSKSRISDAVVSKTKLKNGVIEIIVKKVLTDNQVAKCEADYFDEKDYALTCYV